MAKSNSTRRVRLSGLSSTYKRFDSPTIDGDFVCYYCGLPADTVDHSPPLSIVYRNPAQYRHRVIVASCRECNGFLSDRHLTTLDERKKCVKRRLRARYEHILAIPFWHDDELEELGPNLRSAVQDSHGLKLLTFRRLRW